MLAVGDHLLGSVTDREIKMSTGFEAGIGHTFEENCGAFSAGVVLIGALYEGTSAGQADETCQVLVAEFRKMIELRHLPTW